MVHGLGWLFLCRLMAGVLGNVGRSRLACNGHAVGRWKCPRFSGWRSIWSRHFHGAQELVVRYAVARPWSASYCMWDRRRTRRFSRRRPRFLFFVTLGRSARPPLLSVSFGWVLYASVIAVPERTGSGG